MENKALGKLEHEIIILAIIKFPHCNFDIYILTSRNIILNYFKETQRLYDEAMKEWNNKCLGSLTVTDREIEDKYKWRFPSMMDKYRFQIHVPNPNSPFILRSV